MVRNIERLVPEIEMLSLHCSWQAGREEEEKKKKRKRRGGV